MERPQAVLRAATVSWVLGVTAPWENLFSAKKPTIETSRHQCAPRQGQSGLSVGLSLTDHQTLPSLFVL